jgi:molybdate transport system regulatory protein
VLEARLFVMKYGARNQLEGQITGITKGGLMCHVRVKVPAEATLSSVMTIESLEDLGVREGDTVKLVVKAIHVLVTKE